MINRYNVKQLILITQPLQQETDTDGSSEKASHTEYVSDALLLAAVKDKANWLNPKVLRRNVCSNFFSTLPVACFLQESKAFKDIRQRAAGRNVEKPNLLNFDKVNSSQMEIIFHVVRTGPTSCGASGTSWFCNRQKVLLCMVCDCLAKLKYFASLHTHANQWQRKCYGSATEPITLRWRADQWGYL